MNQDTTYELAIKILEKVGGDISQPFESTYDVCIAILAKVGGDTTQQFNNIYDVIAAIIPLAGVYDPGCCVLEELNALYNGTFNPSAGFNGFSKANVNVPTGGSCKPEEVGNETIVENGKVKFTPTEGSVFSEMNVDVQVPLPTLEERTTREIVRNGNYTIGPTINPETSRPYDGMKLCDVNVNIPEKTFTTEEKTVEITQNGQTIVDKSTDKDGITKVTINTNVPSNVTDATYTATENGVVNLPPPEGYDGMSNLELTVDVKGAGTQDWVIDVTDEYYGSRERESSSGFYLISGKPQRNYMGNLNYVLEANDFAVSPFNLKVNIKGANRNFEQKLVADSDKLISFDIDQITGGSRTTFRNTPLIKNCKNLQSLRINLNSSATFSSIINNSALGPNDCVGYVCTYNKYGSGADNFDVNIKGLKKFDFFGSFDLSSSPNRLNKFNNFALNDAYQLIEFPSNTDNPLNFSECYSFAIRNANSLIDLPLLTPVTSNFGDALDLFEISSTSLTNWPGVQSVSWGNNYNDYIQLKINCPALSEQSLRDIGTNINSCSNSYSGIKFPQSVLDRMTPEIKSIYTGKGISLSAL